MKLVLNDGTQWPGTAFAARRAIAGEVVFNTAMTGYVEALTDPSYRGQILVLTYPLVGNYGVPPPREPSSIDEPFESGRIQVQGLIVQNYVDPYSHHGATRSLSEWLRQEDVPALTGVDTRALTKRLREHGTMAGEIRGGSESPHRVDMQQEVFRLVAPREPKSYGEGDVNILLIDVGAKDNIVRSLVRRGARVNRVPWFDDIGRFASQADGVIIGNGPGDPSDLVSLVDSLAVLLETYHRPIFGICLGHQLLARAAGAQTYKLAYGHRGVNQPVQDLITRRSFITSQNHGFAVEVDSLPDGWEPWFININDGSNEGIRSLTRPYFSVQFHPEAKPGPEDTGFLFDEFLSAVRGMR